ncbi:putative bifunctional diguanylate cyclase/phosphodiesterase [Pseudidiomarina sp. E22-M8]|uniref:putative bifunctional diguanylate cyclase/phosphodiesterase n=1 Tax=Pseudidiomarina sp. E22-M8 TaxID=3424768 RepID=UPI00403D21E2
MFTRFSPSAARKFVIAVASFFIINGLVGIIEFSFYQDQLLMALIPATLSAATLLIGFGSIALCLRKKKLLRAITAVLVLLLAAILWLINYTDISHLVALPLEIVIPILTGTALLFLFPPTTAVGRVIWPLGIAFDFIIFAFLQANLWGLPILPNFEPTQTNFPALTLVAILTLFGTLAFAILYQLAKQPPTVNTVPKRTVFTLMTIATIGFGVWYSMNLNNLATVSNDARTKTTMIGSMIDDTLIEQRKLAQRIQQRLTNIDDSQSYQRLLRFDLETYQRDYDIVRGFVIYDEQLKPVDTTGFGKAFLEQGFLSSSRFHEWLKSTNVSIEMIISGTSLASENPIFMLSIPTRAPQGQLFRVVMLLDVNQVISTKYLGPFESIQTYLQLTPELLLPMGRGDNEILTQNQLKQRFPHYVSAEIKLDSAGQATFFSVLRDYSQLRGDALVNQLMLWLTFAFIFIYVLAEDNAQRLTEKQDELRYLARHDDVTNLLRRDVFNKFLQDCDKTAGEHFRAMLFLNLDGFKPINDSLGQRLGDNVLAETAARIRAVAPSNAQLARFSGDEFVVYFESSDLIDLSPLTNELLQVIRKPYLINNLEVHLTASVGSVSSNGSDRFATNMLQHAEVAMNQAKQLGGNLARHFVQQMAHDYQRQVHLRNALQIALDKKELKVFYQPIYDTQTHEIVALESLVRWRDHGEFISPAEFIPIAENTGQIIPLGEQVLEQVLSDIKQYPVLQQLQVAVNVSAQQLQRYDFAKLLQARLQHHHINASNLTLELTEGIFVGEGKATIASLQALRDLGCCVAIDDFGTGFSSLSYLNRLPADVIKIDRAFTAGLTEDSELQAVVRGIIELCAYLGKEVVVEGVESAAQCEIFSQLGVQRLQGFYFARPMPLADVLKLLNN